ncbi:MAG: histidine kinase [Salegentibacter sp.]
MDFILHSFLWHVTVTAIFILCVISGIISYHSKEKSFGYYALYSFFLLIFLSFKVPYEFALRDLMYESRLASVNWYIQVIYNSIYFVFFVHFLDIKKHYFKFYKFIKGVVGVMFAVSTILFAGSLLFSSEVFRYFFIYGFTPIMFGFAIYTVAKAFTIPGKLKFFITFGSITYIVLAVIALLLSIFQPSFNRFEPLVYFYAGIFVEQLAFALGLAYKVKVINREFLFQLQENEKIRNDQNKMLEKRLQEKEDELLRLTAKAERQRLSHLKSEYENEINQLHLSSLQNQMNPHFIFNALNSIKVFLRNNDTSQAVYYLTKFSKLIRKILEGSRVRNVSLKEELEMIKLYLSIENMRFEETIYSPIIIDDDVDVNLIKVPPLILQPFVENALWHGLMLSKKEEKKIEIKVYNQNNVLMLSVKDNGVGRERSGKKKRRKMFQKKSVGLRMTRERLKYFNQKEHLNYSFSIIDLKNEDEEPMGTEILFEFQTQGRQQSASFSPYLRTDH